MLISLSKKIFAGYNKFVIKNPTVGMSLTSAAGMCLGNFVCQALMYNKTKEIDFGKVVQYGGFGLIASGPFMRYWWYALELKVFTNPNLFLRPVQMMLLDQATTPWILNAAFLYYIGITDGKSMSESIGEVKKNLVSVVLESYKFWPAATLLNFYVIPLHNRILFSNIIAIMWATYLSFLLVETNKPEKKL